MAAPKRYKMNTNRIDKLIDFRMRWIHDAMWRRRQWRRHHFILVWRMFVPVWHFFLHRHRFILFGQFAQYSMFDVMHFPHQARLHHIITADQLPNKYISMVFRMRTAHSTQSMFANCTQPYVPTHGRQFFDGQQSWLPLCRSGGINNLVTVRLWLSWCTTMRDAATPFQIAIMRNLCTALAARYTTGRSCARSLSLIPLRCK